MQADALKWLLPHPRNPTKCPQHRSSIMENRKLWVMLDCSTRDKQTDRQTEQKIHITYFYMPQHLNIY